MSRKPPKSEDEEGEEQDLNAIFDLDRTGLIRKLVSDMEQCLHTVQVAREELKGVTKSAMEAQFNRREINAMRRLAKLRLDDKINAAKEELEALEKISDVLGISLFRRRLERDEDEER